MLEMQVSVSLFSAVSRDKNSTKLSQFCTPSFMGRGAAIQHVVVIPHGNDLLLKQHAQSGHLIALRSAVHGLGRSTGLFPQLLALGALAE